MSTPTPVKQAPIKQLGAVARRVVEEQRLHQNEPEKFRPLSSGLADLDKALDGYDTKWYLCVGGEAKSGKTTFVQHLATVIAATGRRVWYAPLEERDRQIAIRSLARLSTTIKRADFRNLKITDEGFEELETHVQELEEINFWINDGTLYVAKLFDMIKTADPRPDVVVMDYLQLFQDFQGRSMAERADAISAFMMKIRNELGVGLIVAFQLGKGGKRQYGGTAVYRDADVIIHINPKKDAVSGIDFDKILQVTIMPSREVGEGKLELLFSGSHSRVQDVRTTVPEYLIDPNIEELEIPNEQLWEPVAAD